jgi:hypothetical protein
MLITIDASQLGKRTFILGQVGNLCDSILKSGQCITFEPRPGKSKDLLLVLNYHKIKFATQIVQTPVAA